MVLTYLFARIDGVAVFLILTAAEETTAVVCACLPVIVPQLVRMYRGKVKKNEYSYDNGGHVSSERQSPRGFKRVASVNQIWSIPVTISKVDRPHDDDVPLTSVEITGNAAAKPDQDGDSDYMRRQRAEDVESQTDQSYSPSHSGDVSQIGRTTVPDVPAPGDIHVRTDISVQVGKAM